MGNKFASGVYQILNSESGKIYIGSTISFKRRFSEHKKSLSANCHPNSHLQAAWNKYGESSFEFSVVIICATEMIRFFEQILIDGLKPQYNKSLSAYSGIPLGSKLTDLRKQEIGSVSKKLWETDNYRNKTSQAIKAAMTVDECQKRSNRTVNLWIDPLYREKAVAARRGNSFCKGYKCTPAQVENRKRAARISNAKRNHGDAWQKAYIERYPQYAGDLNG